MVGTGRKKGTGVEMKGVDLLASIINLEGNLKFELCFLRNDMFDYRPERSNFENWVPFILCLNLPNRYTIIGESSKAIMTIFEVDKLINGVKSVLSHVKTRKNGIYMFNSSEGYFELKLETIPVDNVIEFELWINVGIQTKGEIYGYDEGVRFVTGTNALNRFITDLQKNYIDVMNF